MFFKCLYFFVHLIYKHISYKTGIQLPLGTKIMGGGGVHFKHFSCIIVSEKTMIGRNCTIFQGVTIGMSTAKSGAPIIGDNVVLGSGCKVLGDIRIGDNTIIEANSVVTKDIPNNSVVIGIPGVVKSKDGYKYTSLYREC